jgi:CBS domain-containing protein
MIIRDVMSPAVLSCSSDQSLNDVAKVMWDHDVGALPVTDARTGEVCGMITDRDIAMAAYTQGLPLGSIMVAQAMSREVRAAFPDHDVAEAHELMRRHQVRRLPVLNEGRALVGFLSLNDLALAARNGAPTGQKEEVALTLAAVSRHRGENGRATEPSSEVTEQAALEATAETAAGEWPR